MIHGHIETESGGAGPGGTTVQGVQLYRGTCSTHSECNN